jgi:hypothetical protein
VRRQPCTAFGGAQLDQFGVAGGPADSGWQVGVAAAQGHHGGLQCVSEPDEGGDARHGGGLFLQVLDVSGCRARPCSRRLAGEAEFLAPLGDAPPDVAPCRAWEFGRLLHRFACAVLRRLF